MEKYCKNCGANIGEEEEFCPDCGKEIPNSKPAIRYCPNCGERIVRGENFCKGCGTKIRMPKKETASFLDKHKTTIIVVAVIVAIAAVAIGAYSLLSPTASQEVHVDTIKFNIPEQFTIDDKLTVDETDDGIKYVSKYWEHDEDFIQIDVMYSVTGNANANYVADYMSGDKANMMGQDGYYDELSDAYAFSFVKDNKLISIYTSDLSLFDEIEAL